MSEGARWDRPPEREPASPSRADTPQAPAIPGEPESPAEIWWSDAENDPWRNPDTPTRILVPPPVTAEPPPALEPVPDPDAPAAGRRRLVPVILVTALLVGLAAGALGGTLGYRFGAGQPVVGPGAELGADPAALAQRPPESLAGVADQVMPSVVTIRANGSGGSQLGSGFVVSNAGHVLTNDHVVGRRAAASPMITFHDGTTAQAELIGRDPEADIAVLQVEHPGAKPVVLGDSEAVAVGDPVLAFGSPLALSNTVTSGIVSAVDRTVRAEEQPGEPERYYAAIQTDAAVNQGNSGGPLVDAAGRVIGINSVIKSVASTADEAANIGLAFAIPVSHAKRVAQEIIDTGQARRTVIGAEVDQGSRVSGDGVRLRSTEPGGPADQAALQAGDVLLRLDDRPLSEPADLIALVRKYPPGAVVSVVYRRGGAEQSANVTLVADEG